MTGMRTYATNDALQEETKLLRMARLLTNRSLNCFQAQEHGDSCLHSTIADLREAGFLIHDAWEKVPSRYSSRPTRVKRYRVIQWPQS